MKLSDLLHGIPVLLAECPLDIEISDVCFDSRQIKPGAAFVAVPGTIKDGYEYIPSALERGASVIICERVPQVKCSYILVSDARQSLAIMSGNFFGNPSGNMHLIGVTGTNGKTTVTRLVWQMLSELGERSGLIGTNENIVGDLVIPAHRTTPESYELYKMFAQMKADGCKNAVMEVSSHALALDRVYGLFFNVAVFTNLSQDHLDFHITMEQYFAEKAKLFSRCGVAVINYDDPYGKRLIEQAKTPVFTYSAHDDKADLVAKNINLQPGHVEFEALTIGEISRIRLPIPGMFSVYNALAVIACGLQLGYKLSQISKVMPGLSGAKGRAEMVPVPEGYHVMIDYAHSPDSMENILKTVRAVTNARIIAVFGCGGDRDRGKRPLMGMIGAKYADICLITSDNPRSEDPMAIINEILPGTKGGKAQVLVEENRPKAIFKALELARENDLVLLMGKGHETYQELNGETIHLDEREVVAEYFAQKRLTE